MNIRRRLILAAATASAASVLAACSSNALPTLRPGIVPNAPSAQRPAKMQRVEVRLFIPRRHRRDARSMRPFFVANSTRGIAVVVSAHGSSTPISTTNVSVAAGSSLCKAVSGGRQCTVPAGAPPGNDDFTIKTYDAAPSGGGFSGAKQLAVGTTTKTIGAGKSNSLNVTVGGVVAKAAVHLSWPVNPVIDHDVQTVTVSALDADNNTIINDGWYSASGAAVKMTMSASNGVAGMFAFSPTSVTFAAPTSKLTYDSTKISSTQAKSGFTSSIGASPNDGGSEGTATFTLTKPSITEWTTTTSSAWPEGIAVGPDNAIWFTENLGNAIGRIATDAAAGTHPAEYSSGMTSNAQPLAISVAPDDHKLWFTEFCLGKVASIDPTSKAIHEYLTPGGASDSPSGITAGPDGNMWFTEEATGVSKIGAFNATSEDTGFGVMHDYATAASSSQPHWITAGPNNQLWFTEPGIDSIGSITTSGTSPNDYALVANSIGEGHIVSGPNSALSFTEENPNSGHRLGLITTGGTVSLPVDFSTCTGCTGGTFTSAMGIVLGPDGAIWVAENGNNAIARIDPSTHAVVEFKLPNATSNPWGIVKGPDGALWFTECSPSQGRIGRLK